MASPLENLSGPGKPLREEPPDEKEYSGLKRSALARLADSAKNSNLLESRFDLAYNAAHALSIRLAGGISGSASFGRLLGRCVQELVHR